MELFECGAANFDGSESSDATVDDECLPFAVEGLEVYELFELFPGDVSVIVE